MKLAAIAAVLLAVALGAMPAHAGDPEQRYYTIETDHFIIHYYATLERAARRLGVVAEHAHRSLSPALDHVPSGKTILVLVDDTDSANGFAAVLPRNAIQLFATAPGTFSELDDHDDWLFGLVSHEYTHILHLDTTSGLPTIYNKIFGKSWSPNQLMPRWIIEGIATYEESKHTSGGRDRGTRFEQIIRIARHKDPEKGETFLRLDQVTGAPRQFPRGNAVYVYGSHFLRYVFDRFGEDALREMSHTAGAFPVPFAINRQIAKVTGKPFTELYDDWNGYLRDRYGMEEMAAERRGLIDGRAITHTGDSNFFPKYSHDGKELYWSQNEGYREPHVRAVPVGADAATARDVANIDALGAFDVLPDGSLIFEQSRLYRRDYAFQDLFRWDAATRRTTRLTTGKRARDPAISPDGRRIAFSKNEPSHSVLAITDAVPDAAVQTVWTGEAHDQVYQPAWSPDGTKIAFSAWRRGGLRDILIVEIASGGVTEITRDRAIDMSPAWSRDGRYVYFDSDRTGIANIYAYDTDDNKTWQVTNVLGGAFRPAISPDGKRLAFQSAVPAGGYDLYEVMIDRARWLPAADYIDDRPNATVIRDDEARVSPQRSYRPIETLAPQAWTLQLQLDQTHPNATIQTGGSDAFGLHSYNLTLGTNLDTGDLNIGGVYAYNRLRFPIRFATSRVVGDRGGARVDGLPVTYRQEDWSATLSTSIPFESRPESSWAMSLDYDVDWFRRVGDPVTLPIDPDPTMRLPVQPLTNYVETGVGARVSYSRVKGNTYGVGPQWGFDTSVGIRMDHEALGSTYNALTLNYSASAFHQLWGKTPVLAARLVGAFRTGDLVRPGGFALGGTPNQDIVKSVVDSIRTGVTGYLRGYPQRTVAGNQFHLLNLEYRQELFPIEHGISTLPIYFRRVTFAALGDVGTAFETEFDVDRNLRYALGGALRLDTFIGYFVPGTFEIGYSHGLTGEGIGEGWLLLTGSL